MTNFLRVKSLTFGMQENLAQFLRFLTISLGFTFLFFGKAFGQTTYTWIGGNGAWNVAANWSPATVPPSNANSYIEFSDGGNYTVTTVPTQVVGKITVTGNTNVTLQSSAANTTLTVTPGSGNVGVAISNGSVLSNTATNIVSITTTNSTQIIDVLGTLNWNAGTFTATGNTVNVPGTVNFNAGTYTATASVGTASTISGTWNMNAGTASLFGSTISGTLNVSGGTLNINGAVAYQSTVTGTGVVNHSGGTITGSAVGLNFDAGTTYNYLGTASALTIPTATWDATSNVEIASITSATTLLGFSGQSFGNVRYNCPAQVATLSLQNASAATTIKGNFSIINTGTSTLSLGVATGTLTISGNLLLSGGTFDLSTGNVQTILNLDGNYTQTGGVFTRTNTGNVSPVNFRGASGVYTQSGGSVVNTYMNYNVISGADYTLNNNITTSASRTFIINSGGTLRLGAGTLASAPATGGLITNSGSLYLGNNIITGSGAFTNTNAAATFLYIGHAGGIAATGFATGAIQVTGTKTFGIAANYIYTGTNGQITGSGLLGTNTGYIQIDLQNNTDAITFTNPVLSGSGVNVRLRSGVIGNAVTFTSTVNSILTYEGVEAQTTSNNEFAATNGPRSLVINNPFGVTLHAPRTLGAGATNTLNLTEGILNTTATNVLTVANVTAAGVSGGSATSYVRGPLIRNFNTSIGVFSFPVGKTTFGEIDLTLGTSPGGVASYQVEYFESTPTGSVGAGLSALGNSYWRVQRLTGAGTLTNIGVTATKAGILINSRLGFSPDNAATAYINIGGTGPAPSISSSINTTVAADGYYTVGTSGTLSGTITTYQTLTAISAALNTMIVTGNTIFELPTTYTGEPGYPVTFSQFNTDGSPWTVTIRPAAGSPVLVTAGDPGASGSLIELNGVDDLIFDGRTGGMGTSIGWIFRNARTGATGPAFRFINDATANTLRYLQIESQNTTTSSGTIFFSTSTGSIGNSNNTISHCDIRDRVVAQTLLPTHAVYSVGSASAINTNNTIDFCNIYNYFNATSSSSGVWLGANTSDWTISNNRFFQQATRNTTTGATHYAININNASSGNNIITGNYIGGAAADGSGTMTYTSGTTALMAAISLNVSNIVATASLVENNTIANISFTTISSATGTTGAFSAIYQSGGASRIIGNTIGAATGNDAIVIVVNTNANGVSNGIRYEGTSTVKIENNTIGSITVGGGTGTNNAQSFYAINKTTGNAAIKNNLIGSATTTHSIRNISPATPTTTNPSILGGINIVGNAAYTDTISFNIIRNLTNYNAGTGPRSFGISAITGAQFIVEDNSIYNILLTASAQVGVATTPSLLGIALSTANTGTLSVARNKIYALNNGGSGASAWVTGIYYSGGSNTSNVVEDNFIHSLSPSSGATANVCGIQLAGGTNTMVRNNMIRLGIAEDGSSITQAHNIYGIQQTANTIHNIYHNSVYIGGTGVTGATNTFAFHRNHATVTTALNLRNNILINNRNNGTGTGAHYSVGFISAMTTTLTSDNNLFQAIGTGGQLGLMGSNSYADLPLWQAGTSKDAASFYGNPQFINPTGNATAVDLHIHPTNPTPIEQAGADVGVALDYDGQTRSALSPTDIGADAGDFVRMDVSPPIISYTPFGGVCNTESNYSVSGVSITDALSSVNVAAGTKPRLYYKKASDANTLAGWHYVEATNSASPFDFNINLSVLGTLNIAESIEYFVVAQDQGPAVFTPNVGINAGTFNVNPNSVSLTAAAFPVTGSLNSFSILPCAGTVTVGTGGMYSSLTNPGGLFEIINGTTLAGNLHAMIISDLTVESGTHPLRQWAESGAGGYQVTIGPNNNTTRIISGTYAGANATVAGLYRIDGASKAIFDGRDPANISAGGRHLIFRNLNTANSAFNSTFNFINDATNDTLRYVIVEGGTIGATNGILRFSTGVSTGNTAIAIDQCHIRNITSGAPLNGIYALGSASALNSNVYITNNEIYDIWGTASSSSILLSSGNADWRISGNSIYQTGSRAGSNNMYYGIQIDNQSNGNNFIVENNHIGGSAPLASGTPWTVTGTAQVGFIGVSVNGTTSSTNLVEANIVANFSLVTSRSAAFPTNAFIGILAASNGQTTISNNTVGASTGNGSIALINSSNTGGIVVGIGHNTSSGDVIIINNNVGSFTVTSNSSLTVSFNGVRYGQGGSSSSRTISGNIIGSLTTANSIHINTGSNNSSAQDVIGINMNTGANAVSITNNTIANITNNRPVTGGGQLIGINSGSGINTITGNSIFNLSSNSNNTTTGSGAVVIGIDIAATSANGHTLSQNAIYNLNGTGSNAVSLIGIYYSSATGTTNTISKNQIHSLQSTSSGAAEISGIYLGTGGVTVSNNMIRLGLNAAGNPITNPSVFQGIVKNNTSINNKIYYNSVYITGSGVSSTANSTYAFRRMATGSGDDVRNNIFMNNRANVTTGGKHYGVFLNNGTTLTMSHNLILANGNGGIFGAVNTTDHLNLSAWTSNTSFGANTISSDPLFVAPDAPIPDLHLTVGSGNPAESGAIAITGIEDDIDSVGVRTGYPQTTVYGGGTAPDIGADEADMARVDVTPPSITMTAIPNQSAVCGTSVSILVTATITDDESGVAAGAFQPRLWWRLSTDSYASITPSSVSGDLYTYNLDLTGISAGQVYQYYIVAQDSAGNIAYSHSDLTSPIHANVASGPSVTNNSPGTFTVSTVYPLSGTVTVGTGGDYTTLTQTNGLFSAINANGLIGNLTVEILSNITEGGTHTLNQWVDYCGTGYSVYIRPASPSLKVLSGSYLGMGLFGINASRVIIDGSYANSGRYLRFENTYASSSGSENSVFRYGNGVSTVSNDTIRHCDIVGNTTRTAGAVVHLHNVSGLVIDNNLIHGGTNWAMNIIRSDASNNVTISNNEIYNFLGWSGGLTRSYGIFVSSGNGNNWNITGNSIYNTGINGQNVQTALAFLPGSSSANNAISKNWIGGSSAQCGTGGSVAFWGNSVTSSSCFEIQIKGIDVNAGDVAIDSNNISNIYLQGCDYVGFVGMHIQGATNAIITNNVLGTGTNGQPDNTRIIRVSGGGCTSCPAPGYIYGIWNQSSSTTTTVYDRNDFYYLWQSGAYWGGSVQCIVHQAASAVEVTRNRINGPQALGLGLANSFGIRIEPTASNSGNSIEGNNVAGAYINGGQNLGNDPSGYSANYGISVRILGGRTVSGTISRNVVWDMRNGEFGGYGSTSGIILNGNSGGNGNWVISNNQVTLKNNGSAANSVGLYGIDIMLNSLSSTKVINNSVLISGSNGGGGFAGADFSSFGFFRMPNATGNTIGDNITLRNNIFINTRDFSTTSVRGHFAIANYGTSNFTTNWASSASDYNFLATGTGSRSYLGLWGTTNRATFANWKASSLGDNSSWNVGTTFGASSSTELNPTDLFVNELSDLHIKTDNQASWFVNGKGVAGAQSENLATDFDLSPRTTVYGFGTDIGADEFTPNAGILPHDLVAVPTPGGTNTFTFAGRTVGALTWGNIGSIPSSITARYYSGDEPGTAPSPAYAGIKRADFMLQFLPTGGAGYTYNASLYYDDALAGDFVVAEDSMAMIKTLSNDWIDVNSSVDTANDILSTSAALTTFSFFSAGTPTVAPLPIKLISFDAKCGTENVELNWATATEINNEKFIIHRSSNLIDWEEIALVSGAGNSNQVRHYQTVDLRPLDGLAYYRLTQYDYDGTSESFQPVSVNCISDDAGNVMSIYPNPATDHFTVSITMEKSVNHASIQIIDINGKPIAQRNVSLAAGLTEFNFDVQGMNAGTYVVKLISANTSLKPVKLVIK